MTRGFDIVFIKILSVITITLLLNACALISPRGPQDLQLVSLEKSRDNPEYFTIKFSSNSDLLEFAISNDYWMYGVEFVGCNHDREEVEYIWWHDIHIRSLGLDSAPYISEPQKQERPHIYEADFPTRNPGMWDGTIVDPDEPIFNLEKQPEDVCFRVEGNDWHKIGIHLSYSNTLVIPKETIAKALHTQAVTP